MFKASNFGRGPRRVAAFRDRLGGYIFPVGVSVKRTLPVASTKRLAPRPLGRAIGGALPPPLAPAAPAAARRARPRDGGTGRAHGGGRRRRWGRPSAVPWGQRASRAEQCRRPARCQGVSKTATALGPSDVDGGGLGRRRRGRTRAQGAPPWPTGAPSRRSSLFLASSVGIGCALGVGARHARDYAPRAELRSRG